MRKSAMRKKTVKRSGPSSRRARRAMKCRLVVDCGNQPRATSSAVFSIAAPAPARADTARIPGRQTITAPAAQRLAEVLSAMGHVVRLQILSYLLAGPADYSALSRATDMRSGPLYFHLQQLRVAGLIGPRKRDSYTLTRRGTIVTIVLGAMSKVRL